MSPKYCEITIRISDARKLLGLGGISQINSRLEQLGFSLEGPIWCLYHDYLISQITQAGDGRLVVLGDIRVVSAIEEFVKSISTMLFYHELTIWFMMKDGSTSQYLTFFNDRNSDKITKTQSIKGYEFGDYK